MISSDLSEKKQGKERNQCSQNRMQRAKTSDFSRQSFALFRFLRIFAAS